MIKNVIFDIGNVLADFGWERLFLRLGFEGEAFYSLAPEYKEQIDLLYERIHEMTEEYSYASGRACLYR